MNLAILPNTTDDIIELLHKNRFDRAYYPLLEDLREINYLLSRVSIVLRENR